LALAAAACGLPPRPPLLATAEQASRAPASAEANKLVPQAWHRAEQLRTQAEQAWRRGETAAASILAERALVAYEHAAVLADLVRTMAVAEAARQQLALSDEQLRALDAEQARLTADVDALELRIKVLKDAEPIASSGRADPAREAARLAAARAIALDARLLCVAARMVDAQQVGLDDADAQVQKLETTVAATPKPAPIDEARRIRARCLALLTGARRAATASPSSGAADLVLQQLSAKTSLSPFRDDRGVVLVIPAEQLSSSPPRASIAAIAEVAQANPQFPLLLVAHARHPGAAADISRAAAAADALASQLAAAGVKRERIRSEQAGAAQPLAGPARAPAARSERIELVFVSPGS
jgi:hypothetical protein